VLNLSGLSMNDKVAYATHALGAVAAVRSSNGLPHWLIVDEAHHIAPADGSSAVELLLPAAESLALITLSADRLAREARRAVTAVASTDVEAFREALATLRADRITGARLPDVPGGALERGEAVLASLAAGTARVTRFTVTRRQIEHRRHVRKYVEGELPPDRSFYFRGPRSELKLRAVNLKRFCELAEGVDEATWAHHLRGRDYSAWMRTMIKDAELADEVAALEANGGAPDESRRRVLEAVRRRYSI
jgi:hypothetical protein